MAEGASASAAVADDFAARWGAPAPLGASWIEAEQAYNFALYSRHAAQVTLLLFRSPDGPPDHEYAFDPIANRTGRVWHCRIRADDLPPGAVCYAYRVAGHADPALGDRFDPDKVLIDPYARAV